MRIRTAAALSTGLAGALTALPLLAAAPALATTTTVYVSPTGSPYKADTSCAAAGFSSIQAAVEAAPVGGTVIVCAGTYKESVTVDKRVTLSGNSGSVVDAKGKPYGIGVAASYTTVQGLTVINADDTTDGPADGIITGGFGPYGPVAASHVRVIGNTLKYNAGAGVDLNSTTWSEATGNTSLYNGIGVNVSDDLGASANHNVIQSNNASYNAGGCGVVLADHSGLGIYANKVLNNIANFNGLGSPTAPNASSGSGLILAGGSGGVYGNLIDGNFFYGNGHGGVALHAHAPGLNFSNNTISHNNIGTNNTHNDYADTHKTGIYLGDVSPLRITITNNLIHDDYYGIFKAGPVTVNGVGTNSFVHVALPVGSTPIYGG